ncbi:class I SAM-dependent methyltransferase [Pseudoalteromonas rubra]|uniref:Methyltransferase domain-containing protein n=1 Tax=Pseudoalteromonas rubra TaxID=43658 RepID=A0A0F4QT45_9GAMM|nr:class I SAM-dependent methyltransferase [Pseudoalteromonas rubra]KJZ10881.1 hypothetical protein TW77_06690 [Pseudoalteromonas rubra]
MTYVCELCTENNFDLAVKVQHNNYLATLGSMKVCPDEFRQKGIKLFLISVIEGDKKHPVATFGLQAKFMEEAVWEDVAAGTDIQFNPQTDVVVGQLSNAKSHKMSMQLLYGIIYDAVQSMGFSRMLFLIRRSVIFYQGKLNAILLKEHCKYDIGQPANVRAMLINVREFSGKTCRYISRLASNQFNPSQPVISQKELNVSHWDKYSRSFDSILTRPQRKLYQDVAKSCRGNLIDIGCGNANLAAFLIPGRHQYDGLDGAKQMAHCAKQNLSTLDNSVAGDIYHTPAEQFYPEHRYDVACSINSLYAMDNPQALFRHVFNMLREGGQFIVANPNERMSQAHITRLLDKYCAEFAHLPECAEFRAMNKAFVEQYQQRFYPADEVVQWLEQVGFRNIQVDQHHYDGAMNLYTMVR